MKGKQIYILVGSFALNWDSFTYTKMLRQVLDADISPEQRSVTHGNTYHGLFTLRGGGFTKSKTLVYISNALANYSANVNQFTIGDVFLHEVLEHIHPGAAVTWALQDHYKLKRSKHNHYDKSHSNKAIKKD